MVCDVPLLRSSPSWREVLHKNQFIVHFDPQLLCYWVVMNIINGIASRAPPCALVPPSLALEEQMLWKRNTCKCGMCWTYTKLMCIYSWAKNSGLKGIVSLIERWSMTSFYIPRKYFTCSFWAHGMRNLHLHVNCAYAIGTCLNLDLLFASKFNAVVLQLCLSLHAKPLLLSVHRLMG